jgi:hypothetical protein
LPSEAAINADGCAVEEMAPSYLPEVAGNTEEDLDALLSLSYGSTVIR